ncbi:MAG: hypothetical protein Q7I94_03950 [Candidatus Contubernalis sp.]|nr:hypothetical protein [Candidatus Contubernalis sp.]
MAQKPGGSLNPAAPLDFDYSPLLYYNNPMSKQEQSRRYYQAHKEREKAKAKRRRELHPDYLKNYLKGWRKTHPNYFRSRQEKLKTEVLTHYGNNRLACVACGFSDIRALSIDHINDNRAEERRKLGRNFLAPQTFYNWLKQNGFPEGYQTLCMNCQFIKQAEKLKLVPKPY